MIDPRYQTEAEDGNCRVESGSILKVYSSNLPDLTFKKKMGVCLNSKSKGKME